MPSMTLGLLLHIYFVCHAIDYFLFCLIYIKAFNSQDACKGQFMTPVLMSD